MIFLESIPYRVKSFFGIIHGVSNFVTNGNYNFITAFACGESENAI